MLAIDCGDGTRGRVTHIDTFTFREFLGVHTDAGLAGIGESYFGAKLVEAYVDEIARHYLLSRHPLHIGEHAKELNDYLGYSSSGTQTRGDSAIDIAPRDLSLRQDYGPACLPASGSPLSPKDTHLQQLRRLPLRAHPPAGGGWRRGNSNAEGGRVMNVALSHGRSHSGGRAGGNCPPIHLRARHFGGRGGALHADEHSLPRILPGS